MITSDKLAVAAAKVAAKTIRILGAGLGSNLPGRVARKMSPAVLGRLARQAKRGVIAVTGTNGKSTTSGLLASILTTAGFNLIHNRQGANLVTGITATLVEAADWNGTIDADYCLFEIDEAALPVVANEVDVKTIAVTNLFRDQLDRFGELDTTQRLIEKGIRANRSAAVLNADDPNVSQLAAELSRFYFGLESLAASESTTGGTISTDAASSSATNGSSGSKESMELSYCSSCGSEITYDTVFYGQLGKWRCSSCEFRRPGTDVKAENVELFPTSSRFKLTVEKTGMTAEVKLPIPGLFNVYNALAAAALAISLGVTLESVKQGLQNYTTLFGRSEKLTLKGKSVLIQLIKNPAGASQTVKAVVEDDSARILIAINDNLADGRDISWLWDADFEPIASTRKSIIVSGQRAEDMAVRLKYAGVDSEKIILIPRLEHALKEALEATSKDETLWVLPTYTCLLDLQKIVKTMGQHLAGT